MIDATPFVDALADAIAQRVGVTDAVVDKIVDRLLLKMRAQGLVVAGQTTSTPAAVEPSTRARGASEDDAYAAAQGTTSARPAPRRFGNAPITQGQLGVLSGWRNVQQLDRTLGEIVGDPNIALEQLSREEASAVLDAMTPADKRRAAPAGRSNGYARGGSYR